MAVKVVRNTERKVALKGPFAGNVFEFLQRHGLPVFFPESVGPWPSIGTVEDPAPGMVGIHAVDDCLCTILSDGSCVPLPLTVKALIHEYPAYPHDA